MYQNANGYRGNATVEAYPTVADASSYMQSLLNTKGGKWISGFNEASSDKAFMVGPSEEKAKKDEVRVNGTVFPAITWLRGEPVSRGASFVVQKGALIISGSITGYARLNCIAHGSRKCEQIRGFDYCSGCKVTTAAPTVGQLSSAFRQWVYKAEQYANKTNMITKSQDNSSGSTSSSGSSGYSSSGDGDSLWEEPDDGSLPLGVTGTATGAASGLAILTLIAFMKASGVSVKEMLETLNDILTGSKDPELNVAVMKGMNTLIAEEEAAAAAAEAIKTMPQIITDGTVSTEGLVYSSYHHEWMSRANYNHTKQQLAMGRKYTDKWGWVTDAEKAQRQGTVDYMNAHSQGQSSDVKKAYDGWQKSQDDGDKLKKKWEKHWRKMDLEAEVAAREAAAAERGSMDYWKDVYKNYEGNIYEEMQALPGDLHDAAGALVRGTAEVVETGYNIFSDPKSYKVAGRFWAGNLKEAVTDPIGTGGKVLVTLDKAAVATNKVAMHLITHPVDTVKEVTGYANFARAMDYNTPLIKRMGYALMGSVDSAMTISSLGMNSAVKAADIAIDASKAAGVVEQATKQVASSVAKVSDEIATGIKAGAADSLTVAQRHKNWLIAEKQGKDKIVEFAKAVKKGDKDLIKKAALEIQSDKRALQHINKGNAQLLKKCGVDKADDIIKPFVNEMDDIYKVTDKGLTADIKAFGKKNPPPFDDIEIIKPTNPSKIIKAGADRDITVRVTRGGRTYDMPHKQLQKMYDDNFFKAAKGEGYINKLSAEQLASESKAYSKRLDQVATDRFHAEAYGMGPDDLVVALTKPGAQFKDVQAVGKAAGFKAHHWFEGANKLRSKGMFVEAEKFVSEGMRQTTKQFSNQVIRRYAALAESGVKGLKPIPTRLRESIGILQQVEKGASPVAVECALKKLGTNPQKVATEMGEYLEALQKLGPKIMPKQNHSLFKLKLVKDTIIAGSSGMEG
ncbi:MAG: hypothetical protein K9M75_10535 [Phycisphaerae bacterium]|nr:hypothetical protein [Phycisphaerae bacterium]